MATIHNKSLVLAAGLSAALTGTAMAGPADHKIIFDNWDVADSTREILAGESYKAEWDYSGNKSSCTRVKDWKITRPGSGESSLGTSSGSTTINESGVGAYELSLYTEGYDGRWFFNLFGCDNSSEGVVKTTVNLQLNDNLYTDTRYPIMIIPGVLGYDSLLGAEYFYRVGDSIKATSNQEVIDVTLDPWLDTEERGLVLADKIAKYLSQEDPNFLSTTGDQMKVNLLAHSHGSTTARVAIRALAEAFPGSASKVASLTTVAGPHYGTPTADGAQWVLENWEDGDGGLFTDGKTFIKTVMFTLGDIATLGLGLLSGDFYSTPGINDVVRDFTQRGMARFNTCYPNAGLPQGRKYLLEDNFDPETHQVKFEINKNSSGTQADVVITDCEDFEKLGVDGVALKSDTRVETDTLDLTNNPDLAYGAEPSNPSPLEQSGSYYGDGLGNPKNAGDPGAIRYFSTTGVGEWNTTWLKSSPDAGDLVIAIFHNAHKLVGARSTQADWDQWYGSLTGSWANNVPIDQSGIGSLPNAGYQKPSDAFIPEETTHLGEYFGPFGPWNHVDEQNGFFGWVAKGAGAADPLSVYRAHANRLKQNGL